MQSGRRSSWAARSPVAPWAVVAACALAALATWLALPPQQVERFMGETGPVENVTAFTYAACALAILLARHRDDDWRTTLAAAWLMASFCMRELDWHRSFTGTTVLRLSWYGGPAPLPTKAVAAFVVLLAVAALGWLVWRHGRAVLRGWRERRPLAITMVAFVVTLVAAKSLDRSVSILTEDFGVGIAIRWVALRTAFEEWFELGLSMLVALALLQRRAETSS